MYIIYGYIFILFKIILNRVLLLQIRRDNRMQPKLLSMPMLYLHKLKSFVNLRKNSSKI